MRLKLRIGLPDWAFAAEAMCVSTLGAVVALRLWRADWRAPFRYSDDVNLHLMFIKGLLENGWPFTNSRLGAPLGQQLYDFPTFSGDHLNVALLEAIGLGSDNAALVMNVFFLLTFPLVALTSYLVFRWLRLSPSVAAIVASLYALLPYHFLRGETHLLLSAYYAVPLGAYLVLALLLGEPLFSRRAQPRRRVLQWLTKRSLATLGLCTIIAGASGSFYYSGFTILLVAAASILRATTNRSWSAVLTGATVAGAILTLSLVSLTPTLAYRYQHGANPAEVGKRQAFESEFYSLRLTQLLLPLQGHRFAPFSRARAAYDSWTKSTGVPNTEAALATLGTLGGLGFVGLLGTVLVAAAGGRIRPSPLARSAGLATLLCFLIATMGGFSSLVAFAFPELRAWNRLSIFIAFFSLLAIGLALNHLRHRLARGGLAATAFGGLLAALLALGFLDQTYPSVVPPYGQITTQWTSDQSFVRAIEAELPAGDAVFELPYADFPEGHTPGSTGGYDLVRPYLHSRTLRWSFGAMRGRPSDWPSRLTGEPLAKVVSAVSAVGFSGVYLDRRGYDDNGAKVVRELKRSLGALPIESRDRRFVFFSLRAYNRSYRANHSAGDIAHLRATTLYPGAAP